MFRRITPPRPHRAAGVTKRRPTRRRPPGRRLSAPIIAHRRGPVTAVQVVMLSGASVAPLAVGRRGGGTRRRCQPRPGPRSTAAPRNISAGCWPSGGRGRARRPCPAPGPRPRLAPAARGAAVAAIAHASAALPRRGLSHPTSTHRREPRPAGSPPGARPARCPRPGRSHRPDVDAARHCRLLPPRQFHTDRGGRLGGAPPRVDRGLHRAVTRSAKDWRGRCASSGGEAASGDTRRAAGG
jgi:hypothetical protein